MNEDACRRTKVEDHIVHQLSHNESLRMIISACAAIASKGTYYFNKAEILLLIISYRKSPVEIGREHKNDFNSSSRYPFNMKMAITTGPEHGVVGLPNMGRLVSRTFIRQDQPDGTITIHFAANVPEKECYRYFHGIRNTFDLCRIKTIFLCSDTGLAGQVWTSRIYNDNRIASGLLVIIIGGGVII